MDMVVSHDLGQTVRSDFPVLFQTVNDKPFTFLDTGASAQMPQQVVDAVSQYHLRDHANVHRGVYQQCQRATAAYEAARQTVRHFVNAKDNQEIIFTKSTTESINLVANSFGQRFRPGDEIILTVMEHHSNIVPWQLLCQRTGAVLKVVSLLPDGTIDMAQYQSMLSSKTKMVAVIHVSNVIGTINPIELIVELAHQRDVPVLVDAAQSVAHMPIDVQALDCDFLVFSAHKLYGPTGVGVLYGKSEHLEAMPPFLGGGDMIKTVSFEHTDFTVLPYKFEAGTPNISGVIGLGASIEYLSQYPWEDIQAHENDLMEYAVAHLKSMSGVELLGEPRSRAAVVSFVMQGIHPHDIGTILDSEGVAIRVGHHCAMPLMTHFGVPASARLSFGLYNTRRDIDEAVSALLKAQELFHV